MCKRMHKALYLRFRPFPCSSGALVVLVDLTRAFFRPGPFADLLLPLPLCGCVCIRRYDYDSDMVSSESSQCGARVNLEFHVDLVETNSKLDTFKWKDSEGGSGPFVSREGSNDLMWGATPGYASPLATLLGMCRASRSLQPPRAAKTPKG